MEQKAQLTIEGLNQIELIKKGINRGRVFPACCSAALHVQQCKQP
jgi:hypothetical protein